MVVIKPHHIQLTRQLISVDKTAYRTGMSHTHMVIINSPEVRETDLDGHVPETHTDQNT